MGKIEIRLEVDGLRGCCISSQDVLSVLYPTPQDSERPPTGELDWGLWLHPRELNDRHCTV